MRLLCLAHSSHCMGPCSPFQAIVCQYQFSRLGWELWPWEEAGTPRVKMQCILKLHKSYRCLKVIIYTYISCDLITCLRILWSHIKKEREGFPGGAVVENLPANAGDTGSSPGLGGSHMPRSNWAREPQLLSLRVWSLCSATREAATVRGPHTAMKSGPRLPQLEKALAQKRRPNTAKNK